MFQARFDLQYRDITPYYIPVINVTLNVCEFLEGSASNVATRWFFDFATSSLPKNVLHPCPYYGVTEFKNIYFDPAKLMISQFFMGTYVANFRVFNDDDENIYTIVHTSFLRTIHDGKKKN
jgi:Protein of unknown function (DUF1091)